MITFAKESKQELFDTLAKVPIEHANELLQRVNDGKISGVVIWSADCGCVYGTLAHLANPDEDSQGYLLCYIGANLNSKADHDITRLEEFICQIEVGNTPATNERSALLASWISEYLESVQS